MSQNMIALSSGEAELYAAVKIASEMIGLKVLMAEMGMSTSRAAMIWSAAVWVGTGTQT